jgi:hypothetical protein
MMGPAFSQLDLEVVQARHNDLTREFQRSQLREKLEQPSESRFRIALRAVTSRI